MIVRTLDEISGTERDVQTDTFKSRRFVLADDGMGFSMHDTVLFAGTTTRIWYKHHLEAVYCIEGEGKLKVLPDGPTYDIVPGTMYALDGNEKHDLTAIKDLRVICAFNPALTGREVHDEEGTYPPADTQRS